jgi:hypothetical protein
VRTPPCNRILEATTMRRTAGIENKICTRVERREKPPNSLPPHCELRVDGQWLTQVLLQSLKIVNVR